MNALLIQARELLAELTPLKTDCGRLCAAACCCGGEDEGMLLFPGEEAFYQDKPDFVIRPVVGEDGEQGLLLVCPGHCSRADRPLGCRIFPLVPHFNAAGELRVRLDARGRPLCPLTHGTKKALFPAFVQGVENVCRLLAQDPVQEAFLHRLDAMEDGVRHLFG